MDDMEYALYIYIYIYSNEYHISLLRNLNIEMKIHIFFFFASFHSFNLLILWNAILVMNISQITLII